ncbi:capsular polysaccharide export protein [Pseudomonas sp. ok272]|uniref:capsular polysaccharide biosynthesis protein n=1 Tax=unclassified Pseudomonas TaxID=196821 RepID=UPI0008C54DFC|nr:MULTISPECIES: capsular polysaccharide biosynthesis protein [unclassified Pseudomonas]SEM99269.1 capsular polysaccharide export protein [Pseudomonas sp. ok272]SFM89957.1 capsular polysaccharide export protein [Pseudomonas sp. ok602]
MDQDSPHLRTLLILSKGAQRISTLAALLPEYRLAHGTASDLAQADEVLAWGRKPSALVAQAAARDAGLPLLTVEDGFLRSVGLGSDDPPLSLVVDPLGIYYDASAPSRLEQLIPVPLTEAQILRARALQVSWCEERVSKYNAARIHPYSLPQPCVLVADQTRGDASLQGATAADFERMLEAALAQHPHSTVVVKVHPDVVAGRKQGHFDLAALRERPRVQLISDNVHPAELLSAVQAVYVMTSQLGFDALLWSVPVHTFGMPFYAGWGLTVDALPAPTRRQPVSLEQLLHAALVEYPRYVDPETGEPCPPEAVLTWLGLQRRMRSRLPQDLQMVGFSTWKQPLVQDFFDGSAIRFAPHPKNLASDAGVVTWGCQHDLTLAQQNKANHLGRVEDGFLRSVGLGAKKTRPLSWVFDDLGIYYDATRPSRLEHLLQHEPCSPGLLQRAAALREAICKAGVTKYNLPGSTWKRPAGVDKVILVPGQVESDASIHYGAHQIRRNLDLLKAVRTRHPTAWLLYKPHPEVLAGTREAGIDEERSSDWCNQVVGDVPFHELLPEVDEVHVLTSQSGFEALLRGVPVTTYGQPFYAGWGLTCDQDLSANVQARRTRRLTLDELVAGTLIRYPTYVSRITQKFTTPERTLIEIQNWDEVPQQGRASTWPEMILRLLLTPFKRRLRAS